MRSRTLPLALALALVLAMGLAAPAGALPSIPSRNLDLIAHFNDYPPGPMSPFGAGYASCWSYVHGDGREYAIIGTTYGTAIYNVSDSASAHWVGFIPGPWSAWREMKSYREWIYIVTENYVTPDPGLQIVRMSDPEHPVLAGSYTTNFQTSHTVSIDTSRALLICNGTRTWSGGSGFARGIRFLSLANPESPVEVGFWPRPPIPIDSPNHYVHDCVAIGNRLYAASIYSATERVLDVTDPAAAFELAAWTYSNAFYPHNSWPDSSGNFLYLTDEQNGQTLRVFDISSLGSPEVVYELTPNPQSIVHNAHVLGNELYLASYTEGMRMLDISDPAHPAEFAWGDSYGGTSGGFFGVWGVCPYFPSGTVIASDMQSGLHVYRPRRDYGLVRVQVLNGGSPADSVRVYLGADSLLTTVDGIVQFAPDPGTHTVTARKFGYTEDSDLVGVSIGSRDTVVLTIAQKPVAEFSGTVSSAATLARLAEAEIDLAYTPLHEHTDGTGAFAIDAVPGDVYRIEARRPGSVAQSVVRAIGPLATTQHFLLPPTATWDDLSSGAGWVVGAAGDDGAGGVWTRVEPRGTGVSAPAALRTRPGGIELEGAMGSGSRGDYGDGLATSEAVRPGPRTLHEGHEGEGAAIGPAQPEVDRSPAPDSLCFVTGQGGPGGSIDQADVDQGRTSLTTPALDLAGMTEPRIGWWQWFYTEFGAPEDWLAVSISNNNGASWVPVDTLRGTHNHWHERTLRVADYLAPSSQVKLRFAAADYGVGSVVEAAIDDLVSWDAAVVPLAASVAPPAARLALSPPRPNPASGRVGLALEMPRAGAVDVVVLDVAGRVVRVLHRGVLGAGRHLMGWDGADARGRAAAAGLYLVVARSGGQRAEARVVRVR